MSDLSFPRLYARTARFSLGRPRGFTVSPEGSRVVFLRSRGGTDRVTCLWVFDAGIGRERLVADPGALLAASDEGAVPAAERARRERARELAGGVVGYATDDAVRVAVFALGGRVFTADLVAGGCRQLPIQSPAFDPRLDPTGRRVGYLRAGALRVCDLSSGVDSALVGEDGVAWGLAEFVAAEEMGRQRGFWWAPDGSALLVARVDESAVQRWHVGDPANPAAEPTVLAYPAAGTPNATVTLWLVALDGSRTQLRWPLDELPYLVAVRWRAGFAPLLQLASRDQRHMQVREVDVATGSTSVVRDDVDDGWLEVVPGVPDRLADGRLVWTVDDADTRRLVLGSEVVTPVGLQVRGVLAVSDDDVLVSASSEPAELHLWHVTGNGSCVPLTTTAGVHTGAGASDVLVVSSTSLEHDGVLTVVRKNGADVGEIASHAEPAPFSPRVSISRQGARQLRTALVLPRDHVVGSAALPVLMDPYGGPHALRVQAARGGYLTSQWLADQGFAVVVVDGRGTPGRGPAWERTILDDFTVVLDDQVEALQSLAAAHSDLDLTRVAIRGWSFGGYLAALAVLRRPDVFHAAVAGAPVTDWSLYDTYYTERYLGVETSAVAYARSSLLADAPRLQRPLLLVHGLADDNVVAAHTLRLSAALLAAGRPHAVLPLSGITHVAAQGDVAENLLRLEVAFVKRALGIA